jgi:hypothetical protein
MQRPATKQPVGQISKFVSSPFVKNFSLPIRGKSLLYFPIPPTRGAYAHSSRNAGRDAMDAMAQLTNGADAYGEVVWS